MGDARSGGLPGYRSPRAGRHAAAGPVPHLDPDAMDMSERELGRERHAVARRGPAADEAPVAVHVPPDDLVKLCASDAVPRNRDAVSCPRGMDLCRAIDSLRVSNDG